MATIKIKQGAADTLTETITGISSLTGYTAKMYVKEQDGTVVDTLTGTIATLTITYEIHNDASKVYKIGDHLFETAIFDSSDHVYYPTSGNFIVERSLNNNPS